MSRATLALLIFLVGFTALTQPGLCPCWLIGDVRLYHPHFDAQPERAHSHTYLFELYNSQTVASAPPFPIPARTVILVLGLGSLWRHLTHAALPVAGWAAPPSTPPPRLRVSS